MSAAPSGRRFIHYWKCDRPGAFAPAVPERAQEAIGERLGHWLEARFPGHTLAPAHGQGNHRTFLLTHTEGTDFVRVEDGREGDGHLAVESAVMGRVAQAGVPVPRVRLVDATRRELPFALQVIEYFPHPDLNHWQKEGLLHFPAVARQIGEAIARWQRVPIHGFGAFRPETADRAGGSGALEGYHASYADYYHLRLDAHLAILRDGGFLSDGEVALIERLVREHASALSLRHATLVHKDLALWNILGEPDRCVAFIDWDDAIGGDPLDDLSLIGCFHPGPVVNAVLEGYHRLAPLPEEASPRFWLHLLRNMIVKAVIRLRGGYFDHDERFFLIPAGGSGAGLRRFTRERLLAAVEGLRRHRSINPLDPF